MMRCIIFFFTSRIRHTIYPSVWSSDVCSSDLVDALDEVIERIDTLTRQAKPGTRPNRLTGPKAISALLRHRRDVRIQIGRASCREGDEHAQRAGSLGNIIRLYLLHNLQSN